MSRSYKHTSYSGYKDKYWKVRFNRKLRRQKLTHDYQHCTYKKANEQWLIRDYCEVGTTFEEYYRGRVRAWHRWKYRKDTEPYPDRDKVYRDYVKYYWRK